MQQVYEVPGEIYFISTDISKPDVNIIHRYLSEESYWAKGIPKNVVEKSIANSLCFGLFYKKELIGFARLITDKATFAYLADVFIFEAFRGKGLAKWLMKTIYAHPELQNLRRWLLTTKDAHDLYKQLGWTSVPEDYIYRFMMRHDPEVYANAESE
jgi:GNAT superfamily N-acetyltransferase